MSKLQSLSAPLCRSLRDAFLAVFLYRLTKRCGATYKINFQHVLNDACYVTGPILGMEDKKMNMTQSAGKTNQNHSTVLV